jgi:hypothetical protein
LNTANNGSTPKTRSIGKRIQYAKVESRSPASWHNFEVALRVLRRFSPSQPPNQRAGLGAKK